jgi:SAM-dependent methyltransferase
MHPKVNDIYQELAEKYAMKGPFLEIGVGAKMDSILSGSYFQGKPERFATNLSDKEIADEGSEAKIQFTRCNSQNMREVFSDGQFATVLSNAVLEHDKYFWRSLDEMKRVLAPGGILAVGAPGYVPRSTLRDGILNENTKSATVTLDVHSAPDYWRFSRLAFKEVVCEGLELLEMRVFGRVPILIAVARMPLGGLMAPVPQEERGQVLAAEKAIKMQKREARAERLATPRNHRQAKAAGGVLREGERQDSPKPRKVKAAKEAKLRKREERLPKRRAEAESVLPAEKPIKVKPKEVKLQAREAKLKAREVKMQARAAKAELKGSAKAVEVEAKTPHERRQKRQNAKAGQRNGASED